MFALFQKTYKNTFLDLLIQREKYDLLIQKILTYIAYFEIDIWCQIKITESINSIISIIVAMLRQRKYAEKPYTLLYCRHRKARKSNKFEKTFINLTRVQQQIASLLKQLKHDVIVYHHALIGNKRQASKKVNQTYNHNILRLMKR